MKWLTWLTGIGGASLSLPAAAGEPVLSRIGGPGVAELRPPGSVVCADNPAK